MGESIEWYQSEQRGRHKRVSRTPKTEGNNDTHLLLQGHGCAERLKGLLELLSLCVCACVCVCVSVCVCFFSKCAPRYATQRGLILSIQSQTRMRKTDTVTYLQCVERLRLLELLRNWGAGGEEVQSCVGWVVSDDA